MLSQTAGNTAVSGVTGLLGVDCRLGKETVDVLAELRTATINFMSVRPSAWNNSAPTRPSFMTFHI
jgi:hypothetical protein